LRAQRIAIPLINVASSWDGAAYLAYSVLTLMTDLSLFQCWAGCFALFLAATYALLIRVALIPRVEVREEVPHSVPRPGPKERPSWRMGCMFGNTMQRALYLTYSDPWYATWTAILVVVQAAWTSYVTVDRAFFHISLPSKTVQCRR
jgi:hypothetical protein